MKQRKKIIIFGNGGLASLVKFYCEQFGLQVAGFTVDQAYHQKDTFEGLPNVLFDQVSSRFPPSNFQLFIAIGASDMLGTVRKDKMRAGLQMGYELFSQIFVTPILKEKIELGINTLIMPGCQVDPFVKFGDGVIAWNGSVICHHTTIGDYCFIAPGATICGKVTVDEHCFIGSNATVRDNIHIAERTLIGAGAVVNHNTEPGSVYIPTDNLRPNRTSDNY